MNITIPTQEDIDFFEAKLTLQMNKGLDTSKTEKQLKLLKEAKEIYDNKR